MIISADWKAFLATLRAEGIPIGTGELIRLQLAFEQEPQLDREGLKQLLACTLVKDRQQRETFELLFEQWCPEEKEEEALPEQAPQPEPGPVTTESETVQPALKSPPPEPPPQPPPPRKISRGRLPPETRWFLAVIVVAAGLFLGGLCYWWMQPVPEKLPELPSTADTTPPPQPADELQPVSAFYVWMPEIGLAPFPWVEIAWLPGILGIASSIFLWKRYRRRTRLPEPAPEPSRRDIDWLPWLKLESSGPELLNPEDLRTLVWGIGRFVSDEPTQEIDIAKTVAATANSGGIPELHYRPAVYQREVWLWQDAMTQDPLMERLVTELETALTRAGLPVRVGWFTDTPERIVWREGQVFSTLILEGHRQSALVAILTDGRGLRLADQSDLDKQPLALLLNGLAQWPQLTFVDVGRGRQGLAEVLHPYGLDCIAPEGLPAFLGVRVTGAPPARKGDERLLGELRLWAAALALSPEAVDENEAFALRRALGLTLPSWALRDVSQAGAVEPGETGRFNGPARTPALPGIAAGGQLTWSPQRRAELLNWLAQAEAHGGWVVHSSLLAKTLSFWRARLRQERLRRDDRQNELQPWRETLAVQRLKMERALLLLWQKPRCVTAILYSLYQGPLQEEIRNRLSMLAAWDWRDSKQETTVVFLPWREADQTDTTRYLLGEMGFARQVELRPPSAAKLRAPVILPLAVGLCGGLGALALGISAWAWLQPSKPALRMPAPFDNKVFQALSIQQIERTGLGEYSVAVGTPRHVLQQTAPVGAEVPIQWQWKELPNREKFGNSELWRAGILPQVIRGCESDWPRRSLVIIAADPADKAARQLAVRLLDRGSADAVLLGKDWEAHYREALIQVDAAFTGQDQLLVIVPTKDTPPPQPAEFQGRYTAVAARDFAAMAKALDFAGVKPLPEVWKSWVVKTVNGEQGVLLRGGPAEETDPKSGVRFVQVCGGTFTMGSGDKEEGAYEDERPAHQVALSPFEIAKTEITNAQYRTFKKDHPLNDNRPVVNVSWNEAKDFCENYGYKLPTEAQWEYAARAGTTTRWSFGDDEKQLGQYAWFGKPGDQVHPVGGKLPNPLGLNDMHGNAWEWVQDCYDEKAYSRRIDPLTIDPVETGGSCVSRGLRGGAYWNEGWDLRSADRVRVVPVNRIDFIGVRCVRGPRRQPLDPSTY